MEEDIVVWRLEVSASAPPLSASLSLSLPFSPFLTRSHTHRNHSSFVLHKKNVNHQPCDKLVTCLDLYTTLRMMAAGKEPVRAEAVEDGWMEGMLTFPWVLFFIV